MSNNEPKISRRPGQVLIETGNEQLFVNGMIEVYQGISPEQVLADKKSKADPYLDYFVFSEPSPDPDSPHKSAVYVLITEANKFDRGKKPSQFKLFASNEVGTIAELGRARFAGMIDNKWNHPVQDVSVEVVGQDGKKYAAGFEHLEKAFTNRLLSKLKGEKAGISEINEAFKEVLKDMSELSWGVPKIDIDVVDAPSGPKGAKSIKIRVKISPAASKLVLQGIPKNLLGEAKEWLQAEMVKSFDQHPFVVSNRMSDVYVLGSGQEKKAQPYKLEMRVSGNSVTWHFPSNVVQSKGIISDKVKSLVAWKALDRVPMPKPGEIMPIPSHVFNGFIDWLKERLKKQSGKYVIETKFISAGVTKISVIRSRQPKFVILEDTVDQLKAQQGIDLSEESKMLEDGTRDWSEKQLSDFIDGLKKKFRKAGRDLLSNIPDFWSHTYEDEVEIKPFNIPLIKAGDIEFEGDLNLSGIGGVNVLKKLLGKEPMSREEFVARLAKIEEHYHEAGYLMAGENPLNKDGIQLGVIPREDGKIRIRVQVAKMGIVKISGNVPEASKKALVDAIGFKVGEPLNDKEFARRLAVATSRLFLVLKKPPVFILRPNGTLDVMIVVGRERHRVGGTVGTNGEAVSGGVYLTLNHKVPGTSKVEIAGNIGQYYVKDYKTSNYADKLCGGGGIYIKSIPLSRGGLSLSSSMGYNYGPYVYRKDVDTIAESGLSHTGYGSVTLHIPVGNSGIASTTEIQVGVNGSIIYREGQTPQGSKISKTTYYTGVTTGVSTIFPNTLKKGDVVKVGVTGSLTNNLKDNKGDTTVGGSVSYMIPLGKYFTAEANVSAKKRLPVYGGELLPERLFGPGDVPLIDFSRGLGAPYAGDYFWYSGVFVVLTKNSYVQPFVGATVSSNPKHIYGAGAGVGVRIPIIGLSVYCGVDLKGNPNCGLGVTGRWEL